ncbi:hypothetical protein BCV70DRAFT_27891 [Testicularia cyperi]|uniref:Uncharacterized protein n=1 Tax=Testicularia cyperi TaxID=1882483 RepID=A0A317XKF5_9BASI|nr:hypothetical protein BCV70DRAFT_27891 [Testicularia cyperi]
MRRHHRHSLSCVTRRFGLVLLLFLLVAWISAYDLDKDGTASIGAYYVQPGRCAGVEKTLRWRYRYFFRPNIPETVYPGKLDINDMDSTFLCSWDPQLTEGYGGSFDGENPYLLYARCHRGTNEVVALCDTIDDKGKPSKIVSPVKATCPAGTRCKNFCATMQDPSKANRYAAQQVQLTQCLPDAEWSELTDKYRPKSVANAAQAPDQQQPAGPAKPLPANPGTASGGGDGTVTRLSVGKGTVGVSLVGNEITSPDHAHLNPSNPTPQTGTAETHTHHDPSSDNDFDNIVTITTVKASNPKSQPGLSRMGF